MFTQSGLSKRVWVENRCGAWVQARVTIVNQVDVYGVRKEQSGSADNRPGRDAALLDPGMKGKQEVNIYILWLLDAECQLYISSHCETVGNSNANLSDI